MANFNRVILAGHMTRDIEILYTPQGAAVGSSALAINRTWTSEAGEKKEECTFLDFKVWNKSAETLAQYTRKGSNIMIEGRLTVESWEDKTTKQKRSRVMVIVEAFQFLTPAGQGQSERPARPAAAPASEPLAGDGPPEGDDVPF